MTELPRETDSEEEVHRDRTLIYRESRPGVQRHRFEQMNTLVISCVGAAVALLILTLLQWFSWYVPLLVYLGAVILPGSLYVVWRSHVENMTVLRTFLVYALLLSIPFIAWNVGAYRSGIFYVTGWSLPRTTLLVALKDRSERVSVQACVRLLGDESLMPEAILPTLRVRSQVADKCLEKVAAVDYPTANSIARALTESWYEDLVLSSSVPVEVGCSITESVDKVARIGELEGAPTLLHCALASPQTDMAQCCAQTLSRQFPAETNPEVRPELLGLDVRQALFGELTRAVDLPGDALLENGNSVASLQWPAAALVHWTARLGCSLVATSDRRERFAAELARITATQCGLEVENSLHTFETVNLVMNTCEPFLEQSAQGEAEPVTLYEWCASARVSARSTAAESASFIIHQSISVRNVEGLAEAIDLGMRKLGRWEDSAAAAFLKEYEGIFDERGDSSTVAPERPSWASELATVANTPKLTKSQERARAKMIEQRRKQALAGGSAEPVATESPVKKTTKKTNRRNQRTRNQKNQR